MTSVDKRLYARTIRERCFLTIMLFLCSFYRLFQLNCLYSYIIMQLCDIQNLSERFFNEFNEGGSTTKLGRLFRVLVTVTVKSNLRRSYLGLWISSLRYIDSSGVIILTREL